MNVESRSVDEEMSNDSVPSTGEKRKRDAYGELKPRLWEHFTKIVKEDGKSDKCECNHCHKVYSWSRKDRLVKHLSYVCRMFNPDGDYNAIATPIGRKRTAIDQKNAVPTEEYRRRLVQCSTDVELEPPTVQRPSSKAVEDDNENGGQSRTPPPPPQKSDSKSELEGEAWMNEFKSCFAKLVEFSDGTKKPLETTFQASPIAKGPDYSISAALKSLNEFEDVVRSGEMYIDAVEILRDAAERECLLCVPKELRRQWLQRMLHLQHPSRYSSNL